MIEINFSSDRNLIIDHLVLDYNGTLALDGELIEGVTERLQQLSQKIQLHVLTADTHGTVRQKVEGLVCLVHVISEGQEDVQKASYLETLGPHCAAIGNGRNDGMMLRAASVGIAVLQIEGLSPTAMHGCDVMCKDINDALDLLLTPKRLVATLRN
ncbi:HAD family hydrolase [Desulforhopalus sp. 52FAK]